jgi:branched-chain amino acid transport system substrate-binding protein
MKLSRLALVAAAMAVATPALADLMLPSLSYRTGPYAVGGIPFADGYADYITLVNERDGGLGGVKLALTECETAYNTEKGVECYESTKGLGSLIYQPLSTGITYQLIPKATADQIPVHTMGYGRTSSSDGTIFPWIFNYPGTYWDAASVIINYLLSENNNDIKGKRIALLYHNSAYGKEPIRTLEELAKKHGYELMLLAVDHPGLEQKSQWLEIRRARPDYVLMWGWGVMNPTAVQEAANIRFPMENFIGVWWSGSENDVRPAGEGADGYKAITFHGVGSDFPVYADLKKYVYDAGKAAGAGDQTGTVLYNRGLYAAMLAVEAARTAQAIHGTPNITAAQMRDGMEALEITNAKLEALGMPGFGPEFKVTCANHSGPGLGMVQQWDAKAGQWKIISGWIAPDKSVIDPLIKADAEAFAKENNITPRSCS